MNPVAKWLFGKPRVAQGDAVAALDIGSSKIACFIARIDAEGPPRVTGIGHHLAAGMRNGAVANIEELQNAISTTVATAEQMAGETVERVVVNVSGAQLLSQTVNIELPLNGREVTDNDIHRITAQGQLMVPEDSQGHALELIHTIPVGYTLDSQKGVRDPVGMTGHALHTQLHLISAAFGPVRTLVAAIARCHLDVERLIAAPYASGLACLVEDEMDLGALVIDMGAGTTSFAVFFDGQVVYTDGIPIGGAHVTNDIARGLTTTLMHAERLKTLYGNAISSAMDAREMIDVPQVGEEAPEHAYHIPKSQLVGIIQPRLEEIFEIVRSRMEKSGFNDVAGRRVVLTGGASQMPGVRELAQKVLDRQVRLGRPLRVTRNAAAAAAGRNRGGSISGLAESTSGPAFATTAGLIAAALLPEQLVASRFGEFTIGGHRFGRFAQWLRQNT
jgi:cell division protein FtsA